MNRRLFGDNVLYVCLICVAGCGVASPSTSQNPQQVAAPEKTAEVADSFTDFDAAVTEQPVQTNAPATKPPATDLQTSDSPTKPNEAKPDKAKSDLVADKSSIPEPTAEQIRAWNITPFESLQLLACRDTGKAGFVYKAVDFAEGNAYALAGSRLTSWSLDQDQPIVDFSDTANEQIIKTLAVAPDGKWMASGDNKGNLQIWDLPSCKQRIAKQIYPSGLTCLTVAPDSKSIATISFTGEITIWDTETWTAKNKFVAGKQALKSIRFIAPDRIAVAGQDAAIWNTSTGKQEHTLTSGGYYDTFALSPDGKRLAFAKESLIQFWNISENKVDGEIRGAFSGSDLAEFSADGKYLVTASKFAIQIIDLASNRVVQVIESFGWQTTAINWLAKPNVLMIASENGRVRLWGSSTTASKLGWKPLHAPIAMQTGDSQGPATPVQFLQTVDLPLPVLPDAKMVAFNEVLTMYNTPAKIDEVKVFYKYFLTKSGWTQVFDTTAPEALNFAKQGFPLNVYASETPEGATLVHLSIASDFDLRKLPKVDSLVKPTIYEGENSVQYQANAPLLDLETELIRKFAKAGWTAFARLVASKHEADDYRDMNFIRGATTLRVMIQRQPDQPAQTYAISYSEQINTKSIPIPSDSGFVEFDGSTQPMLVASTKMSLEQTRDFYVQQMAAEGWLRRDSGASFKEDSGWMDFIRGQSDVSIVLKRLDSGVTQVLIGDDLKHSSWQLKDPVKPDESVAKNGIEAADLSALNGWNIVKYDAEQKQIDLVAKSATTLAVAQAYTAELEKFGWKTDGRGVKSEEYVLVDFTKGRSEITLRATLRGNEVQASLSGDGLLWNKPLPTAKKIIAYETWLRINNRPASLELLDTYIAEMKAIQP